MNFKNLLSEKYELLFYGCIVLILIFPAFFINLGITPLIEDEAIRGLVTMEMDISNQYIVPTIGGSFYYNKPPLFNWIILPFFKAGGYNELMLRLPTVISLLLFSLTIFLSLRKHLSNRVAFITALIFLTCGRILVYESLKGLIDILFSWVLFGNFMVLYNGIKNRNYFRAFLFSNLLLVIAFMFKGLPALVFQAITVIVILFIWERWRFYKYILSWEFVTGTLVFVLITGSYYWLYFNQNPGSTQEMISTLFQQSARRTALRFGFTATLKHFFTYPFEFVIHFLPWTLLAMYVFKKGSKELISNKFLKCSFWVFLVNIVIYWTSPESFPRYVLMLVPMLYLILVYLHENLNEDNWIVDKFLYYFFMSCFALSLLIVLLLPLRPETSSQPYVWFKAGFLYFSLVGLILLSSIKQNNILIHTALFLLIFRIGFNWFVIPHRLANSEKAYAREEAKKIGVFARQNSVYVYGTPFKNYKEDVSKKYISFFDRFYITAQSGKIIPDIGVIRPDIYYLIDTVSCVQKPLVMFPELGAIRNKDFRVLARLK